MTGLKYAAGIDIDLNIKGASRQLQELQKQLAEISNMKVDIGTGNLTADIEKASEAAMKLSAHLATATNPKTGNLDFTKFYTSIQKSGASLQEYGEALQRMGPAGQKAFVSLADSISKSEIPLKRTSQMVDKMWDGLKRTAGWQLQSSIIHGIMGSIQSAVGYAKDLNSSLNDIRIVTGRSTEQMAQFAKQANQAAKSLSTTTTDYTKASLIYYQQGLSDAEVKQRTEATIKMANVSGQSAQNVSSQMTAIWNNFDNGSKSLQYYGDVITALGAKTAASSEEIAQGIQKFAAISDTIGLSYEYAASALATVTATTRESADIVGNSYKTLFSRIQGLQLGETLDDGTTLNKYSTALAKVGISIKDSSGNLKDMDSILNEMGSKWETLSKDQQMGLAQTVAGVRQYTQLVALMDNWDTFQQNLQTAKSSSGTLDAQAAIYAESWEAASDRVRTSWEGLWDNLIDSEGFITVLDMTSGLVGILDNMVTGLGGASGALLSFGGIMTKIFNKQIASGISDVAYGIKMLFPSQQQKMVDARNNFILEAKDIIASDTELMSGKTNESKALNFGLMNQLESSLLYSANRDKMSAMQKFNADIYNKQMELSAEQRMKISKQADDSARARADFYMEHGESDINFLGQTSVSARDRGYQSSIAALEASKDYKFKELEKLANIQKPSKSILRQMDNLQGEIEYLDAVSIPEIKKKQETLKQDQSGLLFDTEFMSTGRSSSEWNSYKKSQLDILESQQKDLMDKSQEIRDKYSQEQWDAIDSTSIRGLSADKAKYKALQNQITSNQNRQNYLKGVNIAEKGISSYSQGLINQATSLVNLQNTVNAISEVDSELSEDNITNLANALTEFNLTATHNMKGAEFLDKLNSLSKGDRISDIFKGSNLSAEMTAFANASMDQLLGNVYDTLYSSNEAFREKYADISKKEYVEKGRAAYLGTAQAEEGVRKQYQKDLDLAAQQAANYEKEGTKSSGAERLVSGASGAMEALAAGEAIKSFTTSLQDGTATLTSSLTSIASAVLQGASGFQGLATALTGLGGLSAGAASGIALVATALLALASTAAEFWDQTHTSNKEMMQNLANSNSELTTALSSAAKAAETAKIQNEEYLTGVEKIKSLSQDPTTLAEDIYESNKKALELINQYNLQGGVDYSTGANGLIEIKKESLQQEEANRNNISQNADYASILGQALNQKKSDQIERTEDQFSQMIDNFSNEINPFDKLWANEEQKAFLEKYNTDADANKFNIEELAQIYQDGQLQKYTELFSKASSIESLETAIQDYLDNKADVELNDAAVDNATNIVANKILADKGITAATQEGFSGYQAVVADSIKQQFQGATDVVDTTKNRILNEDAIKQILESQGQKGAHGFRVDSGVVYYTLDGESQERSYTGETLNYLNAANQIDNKKAIDAANETWKKAITNFGEDAAEAGLNIEQLGTISGASADSVQALFTQGEEAFKSAYGDNKAAAAKEYAKVDEIFGDDGIVKALGLDPATLSEVSMGTLETLQNQAEGMGAEGASYIGELFAGLKEATGAETAEDLAKIITALSSMDFSENSYLNLLNLKSILESFGFEFETSGLEKLYAILARIAGLSPGNGIEDLADTNKKITENRGALNQIAPDKAIDEATKNAGIAAGLNANDFVKDENGNYVYNGSQENIKYAKDVADRAFASNQFLTNQAQYFYKEAFGDNTGQTYESFQDLYDAAVALEPGVADFINKLGLDLSSTDSDVQNQILEAYNQAVENGQTSEETQQANIQDYMAQITSANDMMNAVRNNLFSGNGFINEDGIISDEVMARLDSFPATSERVAESFNALKAARENYQEAINDEDPNNDMEADNLYNQAMANYDLATAIDAVAEARGLDAEQVAFYTEQLQNSMDADELSKYSPDALADLGADLAEQKNTIDALNKAWKDLSSILSKDELTEEKGEALKQLGKYLDQLTNSTLTAGKSFSDLDKGYKKFLANGGNMQKVLKGDRKEITKLARAMEGLEDQTLDSTSANKKYGKTYGDIYKAIDEAGEQIDDSLKEGLITPESFMGDAATQQQNYDTLKSMLYNMTVDNMQRTGQSWEQAAAETAAATGYALVEGVNAGMDAGGLSSGKVGIDATPVQGNASNPPTKTGEPSIAYGVDYTCVDCGHGYYDHIPTAVSEQIPAAQTTAPAMDAVEVHKLGDAPKGAPAGGGGGGGGSKPKEPKKVAVKRKSQIVKRYKQNDFKRESAAKAKKSEENKKDYLYGEQKIAQLEKINKLTEKEAHITADRIKESREYLVEDRQNLIKMLQKYGFEAEFDTDGFLANYEKTWNKIYQEIAALYEDNLLTEEEEKIEEDLNIKLEELEGALEDYENSLSELADDIEAYEESLFEMYDNKVDALEHKVEFKVELSEDDLEYLDFWIESLGDNIYNAIEAIEAMGAKANALFDGLETYQQGIMDIMSLSEDPLQVWATGGIEGILTQAQVDALRDNRDGLADYMQQLIDLRDEIKDKVLDTFDDWQEKLDSTLTTIEHYTSVLEHFKNMIDIVGKDSLGLNNQFMANLEQSAINQSLDSIDANKAYYDNLVEIQQEAQEKLEEARARGDQSSADHWEEVVQSTTEAMQDAQDALLTSLEDSLNLIAEQFEANMERAVETFNDALYAYGGLEGLSNDYDRIRENADLMAADYEKIYELSKINRNINKTLDDTKIIAGKQKLKSLQKEINDLQNSGVELSKYDLEYLQAKYELRLAEIELENAQNAKSTVRLSKDDEGNWSYIYTRNEEDIEESYQKYEDALYEMQKLSQEYLEEMSSTMLDTSSAMMEEIQNLRIQDFNSYEEYQKEIKHIQDKYAESLRLQENELNKAVSNSQQIYEQDWRNYNLITGYKISDSEKWADAFRESTIGQLLNSDSIVSSFSDTILGLTDILTKNLSNSAVSYFDNIDKAFASYGTSIEDFGKHVEDTTEKISNKSKKAVEDAKSMASEMNDAFKEIAETVADWQEEFSLKIDEMLEKIKTLIQDINTAIETSAKYNKDNNGAENLIGSQEAIELLNKTGKFGQWSSDGSVGVKVDGKATNFVDYNAALIEEIDDAVARYANAKTGSSEREKYGEQLKELFKRYWEYRDIVNRVYDPTNLTTNMAAPTFTSMDTGGYTGEWGDAGKFAMLHEKELVLNKDDTKNFLDALNISREVINSMIEMNARQSSLALGDLMPMSVQDTSQILEQSVTIQAEFPNATDHNEIEEAFSNLINTASQYANRYND